jgi:peptidoglycan pentaglycine glycine transferase (the first glycine)
MRPSSPPSSSTGKLAFSSALSDPAWDAFVESTPGGHHLQSSLWGQVKATQGWRVARVTIARDGAIVAGCQLLLRDLPLVGAIAYAPRGPLTHGHDARELDEVLDAVNELLALESAVYLKLQPPVDRPDMDQVLRGRGFVPSTLAPAPVATVRVDVTRPLDEVLGGMRSSTRRHIRTAERNGGRVRLAGEEDLRMFTRLIEQTGARKEFQMYPREYYELIWRVFSPQHGCILLAQEDGRVLAGTLLVAFADTVLYKMGGWSGERSSIYPNELMHWAGIRWAHEHGCHYYDLEGVRPDVARRMLAGEDPPEAREGVMHFKLGFGGELVIYPHAYDLAASRVLGPIFRRMAPKLDRWNPIAHRLLGRVH